MMTEPHQQALEKLAELHSQLASIHPALEKLQPVAIAREGRFLIYDVPEGEEGYQLVQESPTPMPIPQGVRAAFPLPAYGGKAACVVTADVFDSLDGYVTLLHEFVHCYQADTCEQSLKEGLEIAQKAREEGNFTWEIEHPFPYTNKAFARAYMEFLAALEQENPKAASKSRVLLKASLLRQDYEYMVWQEWKEGLARWVENLCLAHLERPLNKGGLQQPFTRVLFYAGGAAWIDAISQRKPALVNNLPALFEEMLSA
jgi:hypothetical protein